MKPKLLIVSDTYHPKVDGTVRFIEEFTTRAKHDFSITLAVPQFTPESREATVLLPVASWLRPLPAYPSVNLFSRKTWRAVSQQVQQADLVFVQGPSLGSLLAIFYAKRFQKPCVLYLHVLPWELFAQGSTLPGKSFLAKLAKKVFLYLYNKCTLIILPYAELQQQLQLKAPTTIAKLGIDISRFSPVERKDEAKAKLGIGKDKKVIGYVGRISPEKNIHVLLKAAGKLPHQQHLLVLLVGDGDAHLIEECRKMPNCRVTGFVSNVQDYLQAMDIFVMPSLTETTSLATLEAMATGLPVIATKVGFIPQYITKGYNGYFFPRNSPSVLAVKLEKLLRDAPLRKAIGLQARKTVSYSFSWERSMSRMRRLLLNHLREKSPKE